MKRKDIEISKEMGERLKRQWRRRKPSTRRKIIRTMKTYKANTLEKK